VGERCAGPLPCARVLGCACVLVVGCAQPSKSDKDSIDPVEEAARASGCRPAGEVDPVLAFDGRRCEWLLLRDAAGLALRSLEADAEVDVSGVIPEPCLEDRCRFEGATTELGPLVLAIVRSPASEMAAGVHLGVVADGTLRFVDLWAGAGDPVESDATEVGPAFALAPYACSGRLALFTSPRFEIAGQAEPPRELSRREGIVAFGDDDARAEPRTRDGCTALDLDLP
jgi:hypothetical protein